MRLLLIISIIVTLTSCSRATETKSIDSLSVSDFNSAKADTVTDLDDDSLYRLESYLVSNVLNDSALQVIDSDCAILIYPTDQQIDEMIKEEGEENFYIGADDSNYYQGMAIEKLDSAGIKQVPASKDYLHLVGQNKTWNLDIRRKNLPAWNLILFKRNKEPRIIPTIELTTDQILEYFEIAR